MKRSAWTAAVLAAVTMIAPSAWADCARPTGPASIPDGKTATPEEMQATAKAIKQYNADVTTYTDCINAETNAQVAAAGPDATPDAIEKIQKAQAEKQNVVVDDLQAKAGKFNEQVRAFKSRSK